MNPPLLYAGFGCRQGCAAAELLALLEQALAGQPTTCLRGIASLDRKQREPGLMQLAAQLGIPLAGFDAGQLQPFATQLSHRSTASLRHTGCAGVAESSALALCRRAAGSAVLQVTRLASATATVALATPFSSSATPP